MLIRSLHRWLSLPFAVFLLWIAATGVLIQIGELGEDHDHDHDRPEQTQPAPPPPDATIAAAVARALAAARTADPALHPRAITVDLADAPTVTVADRPRGGTRIVFDPATGHTERHVEQPSFHQTLTRLHALAFAGPAGTVVSLITGLALASFVVTGMLVYLDMFRRRARAGKRGLFWRR